MSEPILLRIDGAVARPRELRFADLAAVDPACQIADVSRLAPGRRGDAITLAGLLALVEPHPQATHLGLHAARDDFHASLPLGPIRERAFLIYRLEGRPLDERSGGPARFFIPDHLSCHTHEIDECANVKFVDHIELTVGPGYDNRPHDDAAHEALHRAAPAPAPPDRT